MAETKDLIIKDQLLGLNKSKAEELEKTFSPMINMLKGFEKEYNNVLSLDIKDPLTAPKAKRLRLDIGRIRIETGKLKDEQKKYIKLEDKAIMGVHNILVWAVKEKEDKLKEIELYYETIEKNRIEALKNERILILDDYDMDGSNLSLGEMSTEVWDNFFNGVKTVHEAKIEAEKKAEKERINAEIERKAEEERLRKENIKLKEEREKREEEKRKQDAILAKEREKREEAERIIKEEKEKELAKEAAKLAATDCEKVLDIMQAINSLSLESREAIEMIESVKIILNRYINKNQN